MFAVGGKTHAPNDILVPFEGVDRRSFGRRSLETDLHPRPAVAGDAEFARRKLEALRRFLDVELVMAGPDFLTARLQAILAAGFGIVNGQAAIGQKHLDFLVFYFNDELPMIGDDAVSR